MRIPYAAEQLRTQVLALKPRAKVETFGEPDGLRVVRSLVFNKATSNWLRPIMEVIDPTDPRIVDLADDDQGRLVVTFSHLPLADHRDPFPLAQVAAVLA